MVKGTGMSEEFKSRTEEFKASSPDQEGRLSQAKECFDAIEVTGTNYSEFENVLDADFQPLPPTRMRNGNQIVSFQGIKFDLAHSRSCPILGTSGAAE